MTQSKPKPVTDEEWTVHALNIHGTFFERWCAKVISDTKMFRLEATNYPVEFPLPINGIRGKESTLDIRASTTESSQLLTLIIECKKNNPDFVDWIFFPIQSTFETVKVPMIINESLADTPVGWNVKSNTTNKFFQNIPFADEARETKGNYQSIPNNATKTKTSNASITEAAYQVALATQAVFLEEVERSQRRAKFADTKTSTRWEKQVIFPIIVTTARLFVCKFEPAFIDDSTGEIPFDKAELIEYPQVIFDYSLPRHLQYIPGGAENLDKYFQVEKFMRMQIMVVHSTNFSNFLKRTKSEQWTLF